MSELFKIIQVTPNDTTKILIKEIFTITVTLQLLNQKIDEKEFLKDIDLELWTDLKCDESKKVFKEDIQGYAAKLKFHNRTNDIFTFERTFIPSEAGFFKFMVRHKFNNSINWGWFQTESGKKEIEIHVEPSWSSNTVIYNAFVRQFGAIDKNNDGVINPGEGGTFNDLIKRMSYFKKLGINTIYLNPIQSAGEIFKYRTEERNYYENNLTNHLPVHMHPGSVYSIKDYKSIDPELGLNENIPDTDQYHEFKRFCKICHKNGIRVILDIVFDHTSRDSFIQRLHPEWFIYKKDPMSLEGEFITHDHPDADKYWGKPEHAFSPYDHGVFWTDCIMLNWNYYYSLDTLAPDKSKPPRNPSIEQMRDYFKNVLIYWIKNYGVDGFRLDVSYAVPAEFWHDAILECRKSAKNICEEREKHPRAQEVAPLSPDILFIGETYVDKVNELQNCGISALNGDFSSKVYTVEMLKGYLDYAYNISGNFFPNGSRWLLFPECHDFNRLPKKFEGSLKNKDSDVKLNKSRWVLAALLPGIPMLHNGYEVVEHENVSVQTYSTINWNSEKNISAYISKVNHIRNKYVAFQKGKYIFVDSEQGTTNSAQLYSFIRYHQSENEIEAFLVVVNMDFNNKVDGIKIDLPNIPGFDLNKTYELTDLLIGEIHKREGKFLTIILGPGESHIFKIKQ